MNYKPASDSVVEEFVNWFHGGSYTKLPVKFYVGGEPCSVHYWAHYSLCDYLRWKAAAQKSKVPKSRKKRLRSGKVDNIK